MLATTTKFSWFLKKSFRVKRLGIRSKATTAFPLPSPSLEVFGSSGPGLAKRKLLKIGRERVLHMIVFVLNFMYLGRFPSDVEVGRLPNEQQLDVFARLRGLLTVCGVDRDKFPLAPGRSGPELASSLLHLERFMDRCEPLADPYSWSASDFEYREDPLLLNVEEFPQLVPYRELNSKRLKLSGRGCWPMEKFLSGPLWLPFQEPAFLRHGLSIGAASVPSFEHESSAECFELAKLWDVNGLLALFDKPVEPGYFCKVFQVYKSESLDRQIGDRRLVNASERHVDGPSKFLPPGHLLTQLHVRRWKERLRGSITDRRDFYHQAFVSDERASTNMLPFSYKLEEFGGTTAFSTYSQRATKKKSYSREVHGDHLGRQKEDESTEKGNVFPAFASLFQGDHLGVEFALSSHQKLLEDEGVIAREDQILGHHMFQLALTGLAL